MAVRVRTDGRVLCAAMHGTEPGDVYVDDAVHYLLSVQLKLLVTQAFEEHVRRGEWWWIGSVPEDVQIDPFYLPGS